MNKNVLNTDLTGKVAVVTGAGGVLCSAFAKTLVFRTCVNPSLGGKQMVCSNDLIRRKFNKGVIY